MPENKTIMPFKVAVKQKVEDKYNDFIYKAKETIHGYGEVVEIGVMAKKLFPELSVGDTVWCDYQSTCLVDGLNVISVFDIMVYKKENSQPKLLNR
jgi:hypothetical protein